MVFFSGLKNHNTKASDVKVYYRFKEENKVLFDELFIYNIPGADRHRQTWFHFFIIRTDLGHISPPSTPERSYDTFRKFCSSGSPRYPYSDTALCSQVHADVGDILGKEHLTFNFWAFLFNKIFHLHINPNEEKVKAANDFKNVAKLILDSQSLKLGLTTDT